MFEGKVKSLAFGGKGIIKHDGLVVFCPFTAPGEIIKGKIVKQKKNYAEAELLSITEPSSQRVDPLCPYFGTCGGCQLQHLNSEAQNHYKKQIIEEAFQRIGKFLDFKLTAFHPTSQPWEYRRRVQMQLFWTPKGYKMGYISVDNHSLVEATCCPIFLSASNPLLKDLQDQIKFLSHPSLCNGRLSILKVSEQQFHLDLHFPFPPINVAEWMKELSHHPQIKSITLHTPHLKKSVGISSFSLKIDNLDFTIFPNVFLQNHPHESLKIYQEIKKAISNNPKGKILDLYCGIGILSLILSPFAYEILGVEINPKAIECAKNNTCNLGIQNLRFLAQDVEELLPKIKPEFQYVILNPPRSGLGKTVIEQLTRLKPKKIFYISCMPPTMARDIQKICQAGFKLRNCQGFDMFPQTAHVEVLALLDL